MQIKYLTEKIDIKIDDGSYVTEREKDDPNHTPSAIRADVLSQLD